MRSPKTRQYTIRGVPGPVDRALRERGRREGRSLNDLALEALRRFADLAVEHRDFEEFAGTWVEDPGVHAALDDQRRIDEELWR